MAISPNTRLGRYEIRKLLGAGGMGEVYLAEDTELGRTIAIKLLNAELASHQQRMQRFVQEAKAASALNHPNILTIYEIGRTDSTRFIATEFIDGVTLRERMTGRAVKMNEVLDIATQIASALAAAHSAGIVHRDIKPENIMVRRDGYIKVLDFGLAKLTDQSSARHRSDSEASTLIETDPGVVMGTSGYMSPEQVRGLAVDARTDVFSLGVVLYEMVAGRRPFEGATTSDVVVSILEREPAPLTLSAPEAPAELERIVTKALAKDVEERYQTIKDMAIDLRHLKRQLELEAEIERSTPPASKADAAVTTNSSSGQRAAIRTAAQETARLSGAEPARTTSSAEYVIGEIRRHKRVATLAVAALVIALAGLGYGLYGLIGEDQPTAKPAAPFGAMKLARLTSHGKAIDAAISPDGKYVVHVTDDNGRQSLWMRHVATGGEAQINPTAEIGYRGMTFSPDGNYVYYATDERSGPEEGVLYQVPVLGGAPRKLLAGIFGRITFSPDGKRFAFFRRVPEENLLMVANADGSGERKLTARKNPNGYVSSPAWSPDGKVIACPVRVFSGGLHFEVIGVHPEEGTEKPISTRKWLPIGGLAWLSDSSGLVMVTGDEVSASRQVWQISYPNGEARQVTNDLNNYRSLSLTADSNTLVAVQSEEISNIWVAPDGDAGRATQLTSGSGRYDGSEGISWTPDGKLVFMSEASGTDDVWIMGRDGGEPKRLAVNVGVGSGVSVSPDGRYIVFPSNRAGSINIWRMDADGSNLKQLTTGGGASEFLPSVSPDGKWVTYTSLSNPAAPRPSVWRAPIDGGEPALLNDEKIRSPAVSPDGRLIACGYWGAQSVSAQLRIAVIPFEGGPPTKVFDVWLSPFERWRTFESLDTTRWTPGGRALTYIDTRGGVSNIWSQPLDGSPPKQLTDFKTGRIFNFDWSRDGKWLALARGTMTSDVVLIKDFR